VRGENGAERKSKSTRGKTRGAGKGARRSTAQKKQQIRIISTHFCERGTGGRCRPSSRLRDGGRSSGQEFSARDSEGGGPLTLFASGKSRGDLGVHLYCRLGQWCWGGGGVQITRKPRALPTDGHGVDRIKKN